MADGLVFRILADGETTLTEHVSLDHDVESVAAAHAERARATGARVIEDQLRRPMKPSEGRTAMLYAVKLVFEQTIYVEADDPFDAREIAEGHVFADENSAFDPQVESAVVVPALPEGESDEDVVR